MLWEGDRQPRKPKERKTVHLLSSAGGPYSGTTFLVQDTTGINKIKSQSYRVKISLFLEKVRHDYYKNIEKYKDRVYFVGKSVSLFFGIRDSSARIYPCLTPSFVYIISWY